MSRNPMPKFEKTKYNAMSIFNSNAKIQFQCQNAIPMPIHNLSHKSYGELQFAKKMFEITMLCSE